MFSHRKSAMASDITVCRWSVMLEYEKSDVILYILRYINGTLFRNDPLKLSEREEIRSDSSSNMPTVEKRLLLHGSVSYSRKDIFLSLVRTIRLKRVDDFATSVSLQYMVGDELPDCFLEPLVVSSHTKSFLRWHHVALATKYGITKRMQTRIERVKQRVEKILNSSITGDTLTFESSVNDDSGQFTSIIPTDREKSKDDQYSWNFSKYVAALEGNQINIKQISTSVPTLFVLWSCQDIECIEWLRKTIFNKKAGSFHSETSVDFVQEDDTFEDSWMELMKQYTTIPEREANLTEKGKIDGFKSPKRAQIILINVDRNVDEARARFTDLCWFSSVKSSSEVSLISLWSGVEGLQSEICNMFNPISLPFLIVTNPVRKRSFISSHFRTRPYITHLTSLVATVEDSKNNETDYLLAQSNASHWSKLSSQHRLTFSNRLCGLIFQLNLPMCFYAKVDHDYRIINPYTDISTKAIESNCTSLVSLHGQISDRDMCSVATAIEPFIGLADFCFHVDIVKCSTSLNINQDSILPGYYTLLKNKIISCTLCFRSIDVYTSPLYRCLHCVQRCGVICQNCFQNNSSIFVSRRHPPHHIFARIPPVVCSIASIPVMWGPSNVFPLQPLPLFASQAPDTSGTIHLGIYCDECQEMIRGIRWKCAVCYNFDYCNDCFEKHILNELEFMNDCTHPPSWVERNKALHASPSNTVRRVHEPSHPMLCIPPHFYKGKDGNDFLKPLSLKLWDILY
ncbi:unnamed protein product [Phytomonas sp. Hart1]|nr:unnamed protein product [Phytomonas sp. Hart1]|eukprot:CCW67223.1 unnamed protein product [Phytomonas sp. isolate Hart1]